MNSPVVILLSLIVGASIGCVVYAVVAAAQASRSEMRYSRKAGRPALSLHFKILRPLARWMGFFVGRISARFEMMAGRPAEKSYLLSVRIWAERKLRSTDHPEGVTADEFVGLIAVCGLIGVVIGALIDRQLQFGPIILLFLFAGLLYPLHWLRTAVRERQLEISRSLPYALDLLTLSVEAGFDFTQALARIVKKLGNSGLAVELGQTLRDIQLGRTRPQALRELSNRVDLPELNGIVSSLIQADELGSSLGPILRVQADQLRERRSQRAEKLATEAPVKILLPLILFIFPTIFIMIFGPIVLKLFFQ